MSESFSPYTRMSLAERPRDGPSNFGLPTSRSFSGTPSGIVSPTQEGSFETLSQESAPAASTARPRRARNLLQSYYGTIASSDGANDAHNMDAGSFDKDKYIQNLLANSSLSELIQKDNELVAAIKSLDGDMKTLVYENYSKFISATDTISRMKRNVDNMDAQMGQLHEKMERISLHSTGLHSELEERRTKMHQLTGVHDLLKKARLNFVFDLPTKLKQCLKKKMYQQAVDYYCRTAGLLAHYQHLAVFKNITEECKDIMTSVSVKVRANLSKPEITAQELSDNMGILIGISMQTPAVLTREYLTLSQNLLDQTKQVIDRDMKQRAANARSPGASDKVQLLRDINTKLLLPFLELVRGYELYFLGIGPDASPSIMSPESANSTVSWKSAISIKMSAEEKEAARKDLLELANAFMEQYYSRLENLMGSLALTPESVVDFLGLLNALSQELSIIDDRNSVVQVCRKIQAKMESWLRLAVETTLGRVQDQFFGNFNVNTVLDSHAFELAEPISSSVNDGIINLLPILETLAQKDVLLVQHMTQGLDGLLDLIESGFSKFWSNLTNAMMRFLMYSRVANELSAVTIESIYGILLERLFSKSRKYSSDTRATQSFGGSPKKKHAMAISATGGALNNAPVSTFVQQSKLGTGHYSARVKDIINMCRTCAEDLLRVYVKMVTSQFTLQIRPHFRRVDWTQAAEPITVSKIWEAVVAQVTAVTNEINQIYEEPTSDSGFGQNPVDRRANKLSNRRASSNPYTTNSGSSSISSAINKPQKISTSDIGSVSGLGTGSGSSKYDALLSNIDRLFAERVVYFGKVEMNKLDILSSVARIVLKMIVEEVRQVTFGPGGFHQLQVDVEMMRGHCWTYTSDDRLISSLYDEIIASGFRHCTDAGIFTRESLESILRDWEQSAQPQVETE
ncbi:uncharacterized protein BJ171DRAFT_578644 [Polychytrium aggregatum]|uniref:uncharacterized protein n=1 Tax=Polychytrium aggregatum TaxID=110093 RepID=UPI0022FE7285|nr:uncharacterized protein BJ171DRAFT_578644 [Polychytrium aggregatum]KAI9207528.1 hypothetical protein BJ171DRAFT_578644 [Polychytrium aggregatum]